MTAAKQSKPKLSQPCACGSGKLYRDCCALKEQRRRKAVRTSKKIAKWIGAAAIFVLLGYGISQLGGVAYTEEDLAVVDFSGLDASQKKAALVAANQAGCTCGCGLTLAQCVATDSTCPIRTSNIERIRQIVAAEGKK